MKKRLAFVLCIAMLLSMVLEGCSKTIEVEADLSDLELEGSLEGKTGEDYSATLVPDEGYALPEAITVKVDGSRLSDRKYDYDPESGDLEIPGEEITGDIEIIAEGEELTIEVEADLSDLELEGSLEGKIGEDYSATLVPDEGYTLPEDITVKVDGSKLSDGKYDYDPESGDLEIPGEEITGDVEIIAEGEALTVVGAWEGTIDLTDFLNETIGNADPSMAEYFTFSDITMVLELEFTEDGICEMTVDEDSAEKMAEKLRDQVVDSMLAMLEDMLADSGMTVDEYIQEMGYADADALADELFPVELLVNEFANLSQTSNYLIEDDLLYLSSSLDSDPKKVAPNPFELDGNTLTIEGNGDEGIEFMFPMVLKRVK